MQECESHELLLQVKYARVRFSSLAVHLLVNLVDHLLSFMYDDAPGVREDRDDLRPYH